MWVFGVAYAASGSCCTSAVSVTRAVEPPGSWWARLEEIRRQAIRDEGGLEVTRRVDRAVARLQELRDAEIGLGRGIRMAGVRTFPSGSICARAIASITGGPALPLALQLDGVALQLDAVASQLGRGRFTAWSKRFAA
jgi:hypothetical protein